MKLSKFMNEAPVDSYSKLTNQYDTWYQLIEEYSYRHLTFPSDKLLANFFQRFSGHHYIAGLWEEDIARGLLWSKAKMHQIMVQPTEPRAPTWSWAALNGPIKFHRRFGPLDGQLVPRISEISVKTKHSGSNRVTTITLKGLLQPITLVNPTDHPPGNAGRESAHDEPRYTAALGPDGHISCQIWLDDADAVDQTRLHALLVHVRSRQVQHGAGCLLLERIQELCTFRRVGVLFLDLTPGQFGGIASALFKHASLAKLTII
jgi:hypothetical protein